MIFGEIKKRHTFSITFHDCLHFPGFAGFLVLYEPWYRYDSVYGVDPG